MDAQTTNNPTVEIWQVDAGGEIYQGSLDELTKWIAEGSVLPQDKVRRGNLRWIEAQKVPPLIKFFNANEPLINSPVVTTNSPNPFPKVVSAPIIESNQVRLCLVHIETEARFVCEGCGNFFCKSCPSSFGGTVKICPMCGAMCKDLEKAVEDSKKSINFQQRVTEGFGFKDFGRALVYPFKYPVSFIFGVIFYCFFTVASQASLVGGLYLLVGSIFCWMLANMLTFGILSNTVDNMLQGKLDENFMPSFDDFSVWDDAIHPFFLNVGVYLFSFGPLIILSIVMIFFVANSMKSDSSMAQDIVKTAAPETAPDFSAAQQGNNQINLFKEVVKKQNEQTQQRLNSVENGGQTTPDLRVNDEEKKIQQVNEMINKTRQAELESTIGKTSDLPTFSFPGMFQRFLGFSEPFILLAGIALIWGAFYLPVAYVVAAYTRNIRSVFNPAVGLDTIKRLGIDYVKILLIGLVLFVISAGISMVLNGFLAPLNLPGMGNIPAVAIGSIFSFYFSIVFSIILGSALYKNSEKFPLFQTI